ncbi:hypothetical protein NXW15_17260 [Bacteroides thetaiotaomicron]|uniref:hypothetical protein n=1 Tax=Bacteroides thetaiotaomicron TaxID=818 RepID=UPI00216613E7|nr:hypothetical protein [Bacteroides thetaiotaomicron]MCS3309134.1 hypothetical protein [Bacteroides thetaiotaomicron]
MKKICLYRKENGNENLQGRYDNVEEAQDTVKKLTEDEGNGSIFDYFYKEEDYEEITDRVKTYEDACKVLGVEPINEQNAKAQGFRSDEIARRKLETIAAALNEGWKPDWNNTDQYKYYPYFYIQENAKGKGSAGLSCASTASAATFTYASIGSRLCFYASRLARYASNQFTDLYEQILIEKL